MDMNNANAAADTSKANRCACGSAHVEWFSRARFVNGAEAPMCRDCADKADGLPPALRIP